MSHTLISTNDVRNIAMNNSGLIFHFIVEIPAMIGFIFQPSLTLATYSPQAHGVIRQYGLLLLCTNLLIAVILAYEPTQQGPWQSSHRQLERRVAQVLILYHVGPFLRAMGRIKAGEVKPRGSLLGGPYLHMALHAICAAALWCQSSWWIPMQVEIGRKGRL